MILRLIIVTSRTLSVDSAEMYETFLFILHIAYIIIGTKWLKVRKIQTEKKF